jgi:hypothetical protein
VNTPATECTHCDGRGNCIRESDDCDPRTGRYGVDVAKCRYCDDGEPYPCDDDGEPFPGGRAP